MKLAPEDVPTRDDGGNGNSAVKTIGDPVPGIEWLRHERVNEVNGVGRLHLAKQSTCPLPAPVGQTGAVPSDRRDLLCEAERRHSGHRHTLAGYEAKARRDAEFFALIE